MTKNKPVIKNVFRINPVPICKGRIHPNMAIILKTLILNIVIFSGFRVLFFIKYHSLFKGLASQEIWFSFLHGLRFDLSTIFQIYSLLFILLLLPGKWNLSRLFNTIYRWIVMILVSLEIFVLYADIEYYAFVHRHIALDIINIQNDLPAMIKLIFSSYFVQLTAVFCLFILLWFGIKRTLKEIPADSLYKTKGLLYRLVSSGFHIFLIMAISVVCWRGGLQSKPLRVSYAFAKDNVVEGHLVLNGIYTMIQDLYESGLKLNINYDYDSAVKTVQNMLNDGKSRFIDAEYPILRQTPGNKKSVKLPNIVIFMMESWSGDSIGALGSDRGVTPSFDALAKEGYLFTNLFSVGQRSLDAVVSVLYSFPSFAGCTIVGNVYEQNNMIGIGNILKKKGYSSLFICGAKHGSMGFDAFASKIGFDRYIAKEDFKLPKECFDGTWGVFDEYSFLRADEEFRKMKKPFLAVLYTLNPHAPYAIPSDKFKKIERDENANYYNALYYCDWSLGQYFQKAREAEYFNNTLFVIVADHCEGHHEKSVFDSFRIPCLFYFPDKIKPCIDVGTVSQLDILPGIIDLLGIDCVQASLGKSPFARSDRSALISYGNIMGWVKGDSILLHSEDKPIGLYKWHEDKLLKNNFLLKDQRVSKQYKDELLSMLKVTETLLKKNVIAP